MNQQLRYVILPQAFTSMIQPLVNVFIGTVIGTSLASAVGVAELTNITQQLNLVYAEAVITFLIAGACYVAISLGGSAFGSWLQHKFNSRYARKPQANAFNALKQLDEGEIL